MENILFEGMVSIVQMLVFTIYLKDLLGLKRSIYWMPVCWGVVEVIHRIAGVMADNFVGVNGIVYFLLLETITFWLCRGSRKIKFFAAFTYVVVTGILELCFINIIVALGICDYVFMINDVRISSLMLILIQVFSFILFQIVIYCWKYQKSHEISMKNWFGVLFVSAGCFCAGMILAADMVKSNDFSPSKIVVFIVLFIINFLNYYFYLMSAEKYRMELEIAIYQEQIDMYQEKYQGTLQTKKEIENFQHDMNNHFGTLQKLCEKGRKEEKTEECMTEIENYLEKIGITYDKIVYDINSENLIIDSIIDMKKGYASSIGIKMKTKLCIPSNMNYESLDLVIILGNLLDNAIEACENLNLTQKPEIVLQMVYRMTNLLIHVENTCENKKDESGGLKKDSLPQTTKENKNIHGIGMKNVKKTAEKYNGVIEWRREGGRFFVDVLLFGFDKRELGKEIS